MFAIWKFLRSLFNIINGQAAPWQVVIATLLGWLFAALPLFTLSDGPAPLGILVLVLALVINCHLGSFLLFWGLGKLLLTVAYGATVSLGNSIAPVAQFSADIWILHASLLSDTAVLGGLVACLVFGIVTAFAMGRLAVYFRDTLRPKLIEKKKLMKAGKVAGNSWIVRSVCWFFGV